VATIIEVDPHDDALLRDFWQVEQAAHRADRTQPTLRTYEALASSLRDPSPFHGRLLLGAVSGDRLVGSAELGFSLQDNTHLGEIEVDVHPDHRRAGVGTALHEAGLARLRDRGRTTVIGEAYESVDGSGSAVPFAEALGYRSAHREEHLVLDLPSPALDLPSAHPDYDVVGWVGRCPDDRVEAYAAMLTQMRADVPAGELDLEAVAWDVDRVRLQEQRLDQAYHQVVAAAVRRADRAMAGYSLQYLPRGEVVVLQDDTLVMPEHRGHGLGLLLKQANLERLAREFPERRLIHTWTDPGNTAMRRTNERVGFRVVEVMHEMQRRLT